MSKSNSAFFILNASVNCVLSHAQNSRAGLYLKNTEPNIIYASTPNIILLRGFPSISRKNHHSLHSQWKMEFDISDAVFYHHTMDAAIADPELPLSRLYYWSPVLILPDTSVVVLLCSVPLIDSNDIIFGVCDLEKSAMLFKLSHVPNKNHFNRLFCTLSTVTEDTISLDQSILSGSYFAKMISNDNTILQICDNHRYFYS